MTDVAKKTVWFLIVAFLIFYLITRPEGAAQAIQDIFHGIMTFFRTLAS